MEYEAYEKTLRKAKAFGNGAHIFVPKEWINEELLIVRMYSQKNIKHEILDIISEYLDEVLGVYLIGSYARNEEREDSDIDVLVITSKLGKRIKQGKYDILFISKDTVERQLKTNILPILPMIKEAKSLINSELIENYKNGKITEKNLSFHIETTKSAMAIVKTFLESSKLVSDGVIYSLILRLRGVYIVDCLIRGKIFNNQDFIKLIEKITRSEGLEAYKAYIRSKNEEKEKEVVKVDDAKNIYSYVLKKIEEQEAWVKGRK